MLGKEPPGFAPPAVETDLRVRGTVAHARRMVLAGALIGIVLGAAGAVAAGMWHGGVAVVTVSTVPVQGNGQDAVAVAGKLGPAVGTVINRSATQSSLGSGFVVAHDSSASYLVTNAHVVSGATELDVAMPDGHTFKATLVGADALDDLAVVSVPDAGLPVATFGRSHDLHVGQEVIAIGSPLGNEGSVTRGVVSAAHRTISAGSGTGTSSETLQDVLQTDAAIAPGNSGGPLADGDARVVGVNVAYSGSNTGIGYSIPSDLAVRVTTALMEHRSVQHPFLGIAYITRIQAVEKGQTFDGPGVLVTTVQPGAPADQAGFKVNDVLVAVDGVNIDDGQTLGGLIQTRQVGDRPSFSLRRGSQMLTVTATLVERPASAG